MSCCICGTVKNVEKYLDKIFVNMEIIGSLFEKYVIILYYDKSEDKTLEKIQLYMKTNVNCEVFVNEEPMLTYRTHRIAKGRNHCLQTIREKYIDYPYFIMMDCDDKCAKKMHIQNLRKYLSSDSWDALSYNHPDGYYDSWALSIRPYVVSCHHFKNPLLAQLLISGLLKRTSKNKLIRCLSAFNGFAIYRTRKFINCEYDGSFRLDYIPKKMIAENIYYAGKMNLTQNKEDCEHRYFHFQAVKKNNAKIMISPLCLFI
jgi:hypothetical protein